MMTRQDLGDYIEFVLAYVLVGSSAGAFAFLLCQGPGVFLAGIGLFPLTLIGGLFIGAVPAACVGIIASFLHSRISLWVVRVILSALIGTVAAYAWSKFSIPRTYDNLSALEVSFAIAGLFGGIASALVMEKYIVKYRA